METEDRIKKFVAFFSQVIPQKIVSSIQKGRPWVKISYSDLMKFDIALADDLTNSPKETLQCAKYALEQMSYLGDTAHLNPRIIGLPKSNIIDIWMIRSEHVGKFIGLKGIINKISEIKHICTGAYFICGSCTHRQYVIMKDDKWTEPKICPACKDKVTWIRDRPIMTDIIKVGIIDDLLDSENKDRAMAREELVLLTDDLTDKQIDELLKAGRKVVVNGYFRLKQKITAGVRQVEHEREFIANSIDFVKVGWDTVKITDEEQLKIKALATEKDIISRLALSVSDVKGHDAAKIACLLQLAGAPTIREPAGHINLRGTIHILLIGNPGTAKTYMAKRFGKLSPINSFQSAANASGRGLVASVVQDKDLGCWVIYPGVVAMCNKGVVVIDEIDKTNEDDYGDHNNAMNDMEVPIAKASARGKLQTETCYLATANPENRIFTQYDSFYNQINMPKDFLDRFDLIYPMLNPESKERRKEIIYTMLRRYSPDQNGELDIAFKPEFSHEFITKYIAFAKTVTPKLQPELYDYVYEKMESLTTSHRDWFGTEEGKKEGLLASSTSSRHVESIIRFAYAAARLRVRDITKEDIDLAFWLKLQSFVMLGIVDEHGQYNYGIDENINVQEISDKEKLKNIMDALFAKLGKSIPIDDIVHEGVPQGLKEEFIREYIEKQKSKGDLIEPRYGIIQKLG